MLQSFRSRLARLIEPEAVPVQQVAVPEAPKLLSQVRPFLPLPALGGLDETALVQLLKSLDLDGAPKAEMAGYVQHDYRRFVHTAALVPEGAGRLLEIGGNPYYTTLLLRCFTGYELSLTNYFTAEDPGATQHARYDDPKDGTTTEAAFTYASVNVEQTVFPYADGSHDVALFCEVLEHLQVDPLHSLCELNRILRDDGTLILTTPNVVRMENVMRLALGANPYDPYSKYGPYGRHNREYTMPEVIDLLQRTGFVVEYTTTLDVYDHVVELQPEFLQWLLAARPNDLGQYLVLRARKEKTVARSEVGRPHWLYRSYPAAEMAAD